MPEEKDEVVEDSAALKKLASQAGLTNISSKSFILSLQKQLDDEKNARMKLEREVEELKTMKANS